MLYQPVFASTPNQECPNQHMQGLQDGSLDQFDSDVIFKGSDVSLLLGDTVVDDIQHAKAIHRQMKEAVMQSVEFTWMKWESCLLHMHPVGCLDNCVMRVA